MLVVNSPASLLSQVSHLTPPIWICGHYCYLNMFSSFPQHVLIHRSPSYNFIIAYAIACRGGTAHLSSHPRKIWRPWNLVLVNTSPKGSLVFRSPLMDWITEPWPLAKHCCSRASQKSLNLHGFSWTGLSDPGNPTPDSCFRRLLLSSLGSYWRPLPSDCFLCALCAPPSN